MALAVRKSGRVSRNRSTMNPQLDQKSTRPVTVVTSCSNAGGLIARALESVARQTLTPAEVLMVDYGSTTPVQTAVKEFSGGFPDLPRTRTRHHGQSQNACSTCPPVSCCSL
ncbi:glycosyltransferase family 2 protein [Luteimonas sp. A277]